MRTAHDDGIVHARHLDVFDISSCARDQSRILTPANAFPDEGFGLGDRCRHCRLLLSRSGRSGLHRIHDVLISGATANVSFQAVADLFLGGLCIAVQNLL